MRSAKPETHAPVHTEPEEQFRMLEEGKPIESGFGMAMREGRLEYLQKLYVHGLFNAEWTSWKSDQVYDAVGKGMVGCISAGSWVTNGDLFNIEKEIDPSQDWVQIFPPVGLKDVPNTGRVAAYNLVGRSAICTNWAPCPEAFVAFTDWANASWQNYLTVNRGIEGKHWKWGKGGWIEDNKDAPFLLICSLSGPHTPNAVPSDHVGLYDPKEVRLPEEPPGELLDAELYVNKDASGTYDRFGGINRELLKTVVARYMACVTATDACHAQVVDALKRNGLYDDTLIIFLADYGDLMGSRGLSAYSKYNLYERAIRVPLIVKPPKDLGDCPLGQKTDFQASLIDILPTMLDVAGLPGQEYLPGTSLKPLLLGQSLERDNPVALTEFCLHRDKGTVFASVRTPEWKLIVGPFGDELYHLGEDPNEFHNLGQDPGQASRIAQMKAQLVDYYRRVFRRNGDTRLGYEKARWDVLIKT